MYVKLLFGSKRAVVGVGMLLIFVATILVSAIAAGVLIQTTGVLQESAIAVSRATQDRLISGIEVFSVIGLSNVSSESVYGIELHTRVRAGSPPIQLRTLGISYVSREAIFSVGLNESLVGKENCHIDNLTPGVDFCIDNLIGNEDTILEEGEILLLRFLLPAADVLGVETDFEVTVQPGTGSLTVLRMRTPELILTERIRLR